MRALDSADLTVFGDTSITRAISSIDRSSPHCRATITRQPAADISPILQLVPLAMQTKERLVSKISSELRVARDRSPESDQPTNVRLEARIETDLGHHHISPHGSAREKVPAMSNPVRLAVIEVPVCHARGWPPMG